MALSIIQWNCRSLKNKKTELNDIINNFTPSIIALSETWLRPGMRFRMPGFACLRDDRSDGYAGSLILVNNVIPLTPISLPSYSDSMNIVAVKVLGINFLSIYIPHPNPSCILELKTILSSLSPPICVMGDFNCHHTMWGSHLTDSTAPYIVDLLDDLNLCLLNNGSPTRRVFPNQNPNSAVDLTLSSPSLAAQVNWSTLCSTYGSDHFPILFSIANLNMPVKRFSPLLKHKISKANWDEYIIHTDVGIHSLSSSSSSDPQSSYSAFISILLSSANKCIPLKKNPKDMISSPPWWDSQCSSMVLKRKEAELLYSRNMSIDNFLNYQAISAQTKRLLCKKKREGWQKFCESLTPLSPSSVIWKNIKRFRGSFSDNTSATIDSSCIEQFASNLAPPWVPLKEEIIPESTSYFPSLIGHELDKPFVMKELSLVLDDLSDSAPGSDGIPYSFLVKSSSSAKIFFLNTVNYIFLSGIIPVEWKSQTVLPLLKPGKDPSNPSSYRPIALSSTMCKVMEHLVKNRLEWFLESQKIFPTSQFGFRKGLGTVDSLSTFATEIRLAFSKNQSLLGVFLDISSAYDNVRLPVLRQKMHQLSVPVRLTNFILNLLSSRTISVRTNGSNLPSRNVWKGLPQGSVLSPLLYNLYTYNLESSVNCFCSILQYADDIALFYASDSVNEATNRLNTALEYLSDWLMSNGLSLSTPKCLSVLFSRRRLIPNYSIFINGESIPQASKVKFLGVIWDSKMSGIAHLSYIADKCERNINILRSLSGVWWGSHPFCQKLLYNAIIRSHFDYGSFLLEPCNKQAMTALDKIQSKCLRIIIGAMKSSPINAMQIECLEPPLHLRRQFLSDRFLYNIAFLSSHPLLPKLKALTAATSSEDYWRNKTKPCLVNSFSKLIKYSDSLFQSTTNPLFEIPFSAIIHKPNIILDFGIQKGNPLADAIINEKLATDWPDFITMYTDASKISDTAYVGSSVWIPKHRVILSFRSLPSCSIFTGESIALLEAVNFAYSHKLKKTLILSDSQSCLQALTCNLFRSKSRYPIILQIRQLLYQSATDGFDITLAWIPSHSGIGGNEVADRLAKEAISSGSSTHNVIYSQDLRAAANVDLFFNWNKLWARTSCFKGKYYARIQQSIPIKPWFFRFRNSSKQITATICRLRLGHVCTPVHLAKLRIRDSSICECGLDVGSTEHIFFSCPKLLFSLYDILPPDIPRPTNFQSLLTYVFSPFVKILTAFITINKIRL